MLIRNGRVFDGSQAPSSIRDIGIKGDEFVDVSRDASVHAPVEIDATGHWVTPGFIDFHTHYDAEVEIAPSLFESLKHGVTSVFLGSCSLGVSLGTPEDICDIFCRVEGVPRSIMLPILRARKTWRSLPDYLDHLDNLPLGPNVASFVGHSNLRMHVMGFDRSVSRGVRPTTAEMTAMERLLIDGLDAGYLGLSIQTLPWDKLDGDRHRSKPLPSFFARWSEYRRLNRILRNRDRVFQGVPNVQTKVNILLFLAASMGIGRRPLRTTVISLMDLVANRSLWRLVPLLSRIANRWLNADFRFQALPHEFDVWADGMDLVIFEEFGAGAEALHVANLGQRHARLNEPSYRRRFRRHWKALFSPRIYHRNLSLAYIRDAPDARMVGASFADLAPEYGRDAIDVFLNAVAKHGRRLRWHSVIANDRRGPLEKIVSHPDVLIGFSDAGAHLRNMAFYNFPLRMLKLVLDAAARGDAFMTPEMAVHRLTGEIGDWFRLPIGRILPGRQADLVILDPEQLNEQLDEVHEATMPNFENLRRLIRARSDAVKYVFVRGQCAIKDGEPDPRLGRARAFGRVLRAT
ncbi:MAG: N-acyl-D-glutamate amidohydrolase [Myxococcota bacterium]|nr:N-acyl-D-glutamate amidohydrolase [Myxococcota bacterium]